MKYFTSLFLWLCLVAPAMAYQLTVTEVDEPYEIVPIAVDEFNKQVQLGTLNNFPVMYEFVIDSTTELSFQLSEVARIEPTGFSLMLVRQNDDDGGVTEVVRQPGNENAWTRLKDSVYGLTFLEGEKLVQELTPGMYRLEVSTPVNIGSYRLTIGSESDPLGYFATVGQVRTTQAHFGYSIVRMLMSSYVYYPLGIIFLLLIIHRTWKYRNVIKYDS
ncbi:MAG: hypothetical protein KC877_01900 [Candidatus Kaiserbacteria bacterium]|nr:hypothetical protein [Candidatus Kaiserbacteria bacterium]MCB9815896.1 hypothetical protein [Candidatus Nomurabacteria bacterium]